jgi:hypothetical protein
MTVDERAIHRPRRRRGTARRQLPLPASRPRPLFADAFRAVLRTAGVKCLRLPARSPNLNAIAERFVLSLKSECLDKLVPLGERHLRLAISEFIEHYHRERNHQGLDNRLITSVAAPVNDNANPARPIARRERLGDLLNYSYRAMGGPPVGVLANVHDDRRHIDTPSRSAVLPCRRSARHPPGPGRDVPEPRIPDRSRAVATGPGCAGRPVSTRSAPIDSWHRTGCRHGWWPSSTVAGGGRKARGLVRTGGPLNGARACAHDEAMTAIVRSKRRLARSSR